MKRNSKKSFIAVCMTQNVISIMIIFLFCFLTNAFINSKLERSFPVLGNLLEYEDKLQEDNFSKIPLSKSKDCTFIVYDNNSNVIYSSTKGEIDKSIIENIDLISDYSALEYYMVFDALDKENKDGYYIMKMKAEEGIEYMSDYARVNSNLEITSGNLFGDKKEFSEFEFKLINGIYKECDIEKYTYENLNGEKRTLVFLSTAFTDENYQEAIKSAHLLWIFAIPLLIVIIIIEIYLYNRILKKSTTPIDAIIKAYKDKKTIETNEDDIMIEFRPLVSNFKEILDKSDKLKKERKKIIANVSHDLKTPITAIMGYAEAFKDGIVPKDKEKQYIEAIYDKTIIATELINRLFEYAKLEHPEYKLNLEETDISEFTKKYLQTKRHEIEIEGMVIDEQIPDEQILCKIDKELFIRLYANLLSNIIKHNEKNTKILFKIEETKDTVKIIIADSGKGISKEIRENLFEPFVTENKARTSEKGTGLGTSIIMNIVRLHDGKIKLSNEPEDGYITEFDIEINKNLGE